MPVGQSIGERPNSYQEPRQFILPNSHLVVRYSVTGRILSPLPLNPSSGNVLKFLSDFDLGRYRSLSAG
jgi:hypothetical protein